MVATPDFGETYDGLNPPSGSDRALGLVDFSLLPHLDHEKFPENSLANLERLAARIPGPTYAIDDQTAIKSDRRHRRGRLRGALELFMR
jgi:dipeptidase E